MGYNWRQAEPEGAVGGNLLERMQDEMADTKIEQPRIQPRWWDALAALLLFAMLATAVARLFATGWTANLELPQEMMVLGLALGLALGQSRFSARLSAVLALIYGLFFISWRMTASLTSGSALEGSLPTWNERLVKVGERLLTVLIQILGNDEVQDYILFVFLMSALFWFFGLHAGFSLTRYAAPWRIVLPAGIGMLIIQVYDRNIQSRTWYVAAYLLFALLLVGRLVYLQNLRTWREEHTYISPEVSFDLTRFTLLLAVLAIAVAWVLPVVANPMPSIASAWQDIRDRLDPLEERLGRLFASLRETVGFVKEVYGSEMSLGVGSPLSNRVVLTIEAPQRVRVGAPYYWRARTYDEYSADGWAANIHTKVRFAPEDWTEAETANVSTGLITVFPEDPIVTLYAPASAIAFNLEVEAELFSPVGGVVDVSSWRAPGYVWSGKSYQMQTTLEVITIADLRAAGEGYPDWVMARYLQVPDSTSRRTRDLAARLGMGKDSPYEVAAAVTQYLRENIRYADVIAQPPSGQDTVDWFLFDYQQGFCNYYATAEVILLRLNGIPARLAVGYAQGERVVDDIAPLAADQPAIYLVRALDAHAWPEVYFPGIGWVEFEPTVSLDPILRPSGEANPSQPEGDLPDDLQEDPALLDERINPDKPLADGSQDNLAPTPVASMARAILPGALIAVSLLVIMFLLFQPWLPARLRARLLRWGVEPPPFLARWEKFASTRSPAPVWLEKRLQRFGLRPPLFLRRWAAWAAVTPITRAYLEVNRALSRLGQFPADGDTPTERVEALVLVIPPADFTAHTLLDEYQKAAYSPYPADLPLAQKAGKEIRRMSLLVKLQRILSGRSEIPGDR